MYIPSDSAIPNPIYVTQRDAYLPSPKDRYRNVYICITYNSQKLPDFFLLIIGYKLQHIHKVECYTTSPSKTVGKSHR